MAFSVVLEKTRRCLGFPYLFLRPSSFVVVVFSTYSIKVGSRHFTSC